MDKVRVVFRYALHVVAATIVPMVVAVVLVFLCAFVTDFLHIGVTGATYQRLGSAPPFVVQTATALAVGFVLARTSANRRCAKWVWVLPVLWMIIAVAAWKPASVVGSTSVWSYYFTGKWWYSAPSLLRARQVLDQFTHTVPLYTSIAYALAAFLRERRTSVEGRAVTVAGSTAP